MLQPRPAGAAASSARVRRVVVLDLRQRLAPLIRCLGCNGRLITAAKEEVIEYLEPLTRRHYDEFRRCTECGRIYWAGSHHAGLVSLVERLRGQL